MFEVNPSRDNQWYFVLKASNGQTLVTSEMYTTLQACHHGIEVVKRLAPSAKIG